MWVFCHLVEGYFIVVLVRFKTYVHGATAANECHLVDFLNVFSLLVEGLFLFAHATAHIF